MSTTSDTESTSSEVIVPTNVQPPQPPKSLTAILNEIRAKTRDPDTIAVQQLAEVVESGTEADVQTLYEGPPKCKCCINWVEEYPDDLKSSIEQQAESKKKALVVRMGKNHSEGKPLALDSIVVQNQHIKDLLGEVFHGYQGITTNLKKLVLRAPFQPFFYRWGLFERLVRQQKDNDAEASKFSDLLYRILDLELRETREEIEDMCSKGVITYELLWALFQPGTRVYSSIEGQDRFFLLKNGGYQGGKCPHFALSVIYVDWDGEKFGFGTEHLKISEFSGTIKINELSAYPMSYHKSESEVAGALKLRGEVFHQLQGVHYKAYTGAMLLNDCYGTSKKVDGRIIIDASTAPSHLKVEGLLSLSEHPVSPEIQVEDDVHQERRYRGYRCGNDMLDDDYEIPARSKERLKPVKQGEIQNVLSEEQLMLCNSHVVGYSLKDKVWGNLAIPNVKEISWNDDAFPSLILPKGHKDLILAFVDGQLTQEHTFDDVIEGKGQGLTILLVGTPGTGKTLTAEAVADKVRRPLYILSAGELGQDAVKVEEKLKGLLELTEKWRAVLLLDECDVFLEKRSHANLNHNEVVAVFLRLLEYYPGMLFLTTNRVSSIDPAFQSRVHLSLNYPDLDSEARMQIWKQFSSRSMQNSLTEDDLARLSEFAFNGRQIKNIVKISSILARREDTALQLRHIQTVLDATKELSLGE